MEQPVSCVAINFSLAVVVIETTVIMNHGAGFFDIEVEPPGVILSVMADLFKKTAGITTCVSEQGLHGRSKSAFRSAVSGIEFRLRLKDFRPERL